MSEGKSAEIVGCHHFAINVHELDAAKHFYGSVLALEELPRPPEIERFRSAWYRLGSAELHVVENKAFQPLDSPLGPHLAVAVSDFARITEDIQARGGAFRFGPGPGPDGIERAVLQDPTGNTIEVTAAPLPRV